jgi:putative hydrolase of the HAD superfamily
VGVVYARAATGFGKRYNALSLNRQFRPAYHDLLPVRFFGSGGLRTSEVRERRWWMRAVARAFERAGYGRPPETTLQAAFAAFGRGEAWRAYSEVPEVLEALSTRGFRLGVISNYASRLRRVLQELGLARSFSTLVLSSECGFAKPSPRIFETALEKLAVSADEALYVGDRPKEDYRGARRSGLAALLLARRGGRRGSHVIRHLGQLPARLKGR